MPEFTATTYTPKKSNVFLQQAGISLPTQIVKRDGRLVTFESARIENAISRFFSNLGRIPLTPVEELTQRVVNIVAAKYQEKMPNVEDVQDVAEMVLQAAGEFEAAKHYILYRAEHAKNRKERPIPD